MNYSLSPILTAKEQIMQIPQGSGIYFLFYYEHLIYIGHSNLDMRARIKGHDLGGRRFTHIAYTTFENQLTLKVLRSFKRDLIQYWRPPENRLYNKERPKRIPETTGPDFINLHNQQLHAQIAELRKTLASAQRPKRVTSQFKKLFRKHKHSKSVKSESPTTQPFFPYIGGVILLDDVPVYLQCSNPNQIFPVIPTTCQAEPIEVVPPTLSVLPAIIEPEPNPNAKVLTFQQKFKANVASLFNWAINRGKK